MVNAHTRGTNQAVAYRSRWIIPVDQPPLEGGYVTVAENRIVAVSRRPPDVPAHDLGDVAILPAFVNAHTHLEFSHLAAPLGCPHMPFADWLAEVVRERRQQAASSQAGRKSASAAAAIEQGLAESQQAGVGLIGEIATSEESLCIAQGVPGPTVTVFRELLSLAPQRVAELLAVAQNHLAPRGAAQPLVGLSPHAPYSVHPDLLRGACALSREHKIPLAMHVAESREELQLLHSHTGPLVEFLQSLLAWRPDVLRRGCRPLDYLRELATAHRALVVHGNYLTADEIQFLAEHRDRLSLVYCPRTHAYFGHDAYPLAHMLAAGARICLGTDSRASNPDLSILAELHAVAQCHPEVPLAQLLRLATIDGAAALGLEQRFGSLTPGKQAALITLAVPAAGRDPLQAIFHGPSPPQPLDRG